MKNRNRIIVIVCVSIFMILLLTLVIKHFVNEYKDKHELDDLNEKNLLLLSLVSNNAEEHDEGVEIEVDFEKRTIISGTRKQFKANEQKEVVLTDEQCQELKDYIVDYSNKVKTKEKEYWPQTDEYPDMFILFHYSVTYSEGETEKVYRTDGALCYPEDWEEFLAKLMEY